MINHTIAGADSRVSSLLSTARGRRAGAEIIEQILVKVNGEIFTKTDLETRQVAGAAPDGPAARS